MSDPVTNLDIEDVLSSIRRLVTEEGRGDSRRLQPRRPSPAPRLLLTPSLRVEHDEDRGDSHTPPAAGAQADRATFGRLSEADEAPEPADEVAEDVSAADAGEGADAKASGLPVFVAKARKPLILSDALPPAANDTASKSEPFFASAPAVQPADNEAFRARMAELSDDEKRAAEQVAPENFVFASKFAELRSRSEILKSKIKALEAAIAETPGPWEPDGAGMDDYAGTVPSRLPWRNTGPEASDSEAETTVEVPSAEHSVHPEVEPVDVAPQSAETVAETADAALELAESVAETVEPDSDDSFIDEDALRQMVLEIVHRELQGVLGERITRNVRKLVRLEIQRALAAQKVE